MTAGPVAEPARAAPVEAPARIAPGTPLGRYLDRTREYGLGRFVAEMSLLALALRIPAVVAAVKLGIAEDATTAADLLGQIGLPLLAFLALGFAPLVETVLLQWLPIAVVRRLGGTAGLAWILSAGLFATLHYQSGWAAVFVHVPTGLVLSWCYLAWRHRGLGRAILAPALVHFVLNALALWAAVSTGVA